jgi:adenylate kinase family enzyme
VGATLIPDARRIWIVGPPGAGKTTLACALTKATGTPHHAIDALYWRPGWRPTDERTFLNSIEQLCAFDSWILDGHYPQVARVIMTRAELVIWLDLPARVILPRVAKRTIRRIVTREELWNCNRETIGTLLGRHSMLRYAAHIIRVRDMFAATLNTYCKPGGVQVMRIRNTQELFVC